MKNSTPINIKFLSFFLLSLGVILIITALYFSPLVQNNRYVKSYKVRKQAKQYPTNSNEYQKLNAIADAIKKGEKDYTYSPVFNPLSLPISQ